MRRYAAGDRRFEIGITGNVVRTREDGATSVLQFPSEQAAHQAAREQVLKYTYGELPRYTLVHPQPIAATRTFARAGERWAITLEAETVVEDGVRAVHTDSGVALRAYNDEIAAKLAAGFVEEVPRNAELERAIEDDPDDPDAYVVYADWLQAQGDPRGELCTLQLANKVEALDVLETHAATLLGPLAAYTVCRDHLYHTPAPEAFTWKYGFIHAARLSYSTYWDNEFKGSIAQVLATLLDHPSARFLREVVLMYGGDVADGDLQPLLDVLAARPRPTLRKLVIGDDVDQISWYRVGKLGGVWAALPNLEELELECGEFDVGELVAPKLRRAIFKTGGLSAANGAALAVAQLPAIERLEIYYGDPNYGAECGMQQVLPLLARTDLPALEHLGLVNAAFTDEICAALATSPLLPQLAHLDLSLGVMTDDGAQAIAKASEAFTHLDAIDVSENYLTDAGIAMLRGTAKHVIADDQKVLEDWAEGERYVSIGE